MQVVMVGCTQQRQFVNVGEATMFHLNDVMHLTTLCPRVATVEHALAVPNNDRQTLQR